MSTIADASDILSQPATTTPKQREDARRYVAANALDAEDARTLLAMLGLGGES